MILGDGKMFSGDGRTAHKKRPFLPPIYKSGSYPTYVHISDCGATWSECGDTAKILSAEEKVVVISSQ